MTIIELLNKIAKGEDTPKEIKYDGYTFKKVIESYIEEDGDNLTDHICYDYSNLNDEVEIIEEDKKIKKEDLFKLDESMTKASLVAWQKANNGIFKKKIDELIDKVNGLENKQ